MKKKMFLMGMMAIMLLFVTTDSARVSGTEFLFFTMLFYT
jgi:hypothetical protein